MQTRGWTLSGVYHWRPASWVAIVPRLGVFRWTSDVNRRDNFGLLRNRDEGVGATAGISLQWPVDEQLELTIDWNTYSSEFDDGAEAFTVDCLTGSVLLRF